MNLNCPWSCSQANFNNKEYFSLHFAALTACCWKPYQVTIIVINIAIIFITTTTEMSYIFMTTTTKISYIQCKIFRSKMLILATASGTRAFYNDICVLVNGGRLAWPCRGLFPQVFARSDEFLRWASLQVEPSHQIVSWTSSWNAFSSQKPIYPWHDSPVALMHMQMMHSSQELTSRHQGQSYVEARGGSCLLGEIDTVLFRIFG